MHNGHDPHGLDNIQHDKCKCMVAHGRCTYTHGIGIRLYYYRKKALTNLANFSHGMVQHGHQNNIN